MTTKRYVVVSDLQMPLHDRRAWKAVLRFIADYKPDEVVNIGDINDYTSPGRWTKDTRAEYQESVFEEAAFARKHYCVELRKVFDGPSVLLGSNHGERPMKYAEKYAPAIADEGVFSERALLRLDDFGIQFIPDFYHFAPRWTMTHGHLGKIGLSQIAGNTALNAAKKLGRNIVMGHTHRLGVGSHTTGVDGMSMTLTGMEVGNLMDRKKAKYLAGYSGNWQQGFGLVDVNHEHVQVTPVRIGRGQFIVDGSVYRL
ncbi:hypothetical protein [Kitasatospora sp. NPDC056184]|uniref:hypothetical protein n=1 Tax=Kitasatospora sp. NPDC056184 TaxID=3345738 RepID=UPI0035D91DC1